MVAYHLYVVEHILKFICEHTTVVVVCQNEKGVGLILKATTTTTTAEAAAVGTEMKRVEKIVLSNRKTFPVVAFQIVSTDVRFTQCESEPLALFSFQIRCSLSTI